MKIAVVMQGELWGGVEGYCVELVRQHDVRGDQAVLLALGGRVHQRVRRCPNVIEVPTYGVIGRVCAVHRVLREICADVVHVVLSFETQYVLEVLMWQMMGWRVVLSEQLVDPQAFHGTGLWQAGRKAAARRIKAATYRRAVSVIAPSNATADILANVHRLPVRAHVIHNPVECPSKCGTAGRERDARRKQDTRLHFVTVARLHPQKGLDVLVRACATLRSTAIEFILDVVGEGPARSELERTIAQFGLAGHVRLHGEQNDVWPFLVRADIFVLSSRYEGLPFAILEAMCAGLPVVATAVSGIPEVVVDGRTGLLVPPDDPGALGDAMWQLLGDAEARARMGSEGARRARDQFGWAYHMQAVKVAYGA